MRAFRRIDPFYVRYHRSGYISPSRPLSWRLQRNVAGGGSLYDLGVDVLDLIDLLLGDVAAVNVTLETLVRERPVRAGFTRTAPVDVDDLALLQMRLARGGARGWPSSRGWARAPSTICGWKSTVSRGRSSCRWKTPTGLKYTMPACRIGRWAARGLHPVETVQRFEEAIAPDWTQPMGFVRSHAECQYRFLRGPLDRCAARARPARRRRGAASPHRRRSVIRGGALDI